MADRLFMTSSSSHDDVTESVVGATITVSALNDVAVVIDDTVSSGSIKASLKVLESAISNYLDAN